MGFGARALGFAVLVGGGAAACVLSIDPLPQDGGAAPADASTESASVLGDGGSEGDGTARSDANAGPDADGSPGPYCETVQPKPAFCNSFDRDQADAGWSHVSVDDGGSLSLDPTTSISPPSSLRSRLLTNANCKFACYTQDLALTFASRVRFAFDVAVGHLIGDSGFSDGVAVNELTVAGSGGAGTCGYYFSVSPGAASLAIETSADARIDLSPFVPTAKWTHVELTIDKTNATAQISLDGVDAGSGAIPSACHLGVVTALDVGILCAQPGIDFDVHEDNVAIWTE